MADSNNFYKHSNDSNSTKISNVDFNTLKKLNTNTSFSSNVSANTTKTSLSKLFSKKRPELQLDTQSLSSSTSDSTSANRSRKNSMNSPVSSTFHNLFHRSHHHHHHHQPQIQETLQKNLDDSKKTTLCLSSNSSNSVIQDVELAKIYNFTNPNFSIDDNGEEVGSHPHHPSSNSSFLDIHKKMLVPADLYIQNKLNKYHQIEVGLGIYGGEGDEKPTGSVGTSSSTTTTNTNTKDSKNTRIYTNLYHYLKPLFVPSLQKTTKRGFTRPVLEYSVEELANFVKESFCAPSSSTSMSSPSQDQTVIGATSQISPSIKGFRLKGSKSSTKLSRMNTTTNKFFTLGSEHKAEDYDYYKLREVSQDLMTLFTKCMTALHNDIVQYDQSKLMQQLGITKIEQTTPLAKTMPRKQWLLIVIAWKYFNKIVRFYIISIFQPLQSFFQELTAVKEHQHQHHLQQSQDQQKKLTIDIDDLLLGAFYKVFVLDNDEDVQIFGTNNNGETDELFINAISWMSSII
ncbi:hypothetical protein Cantr_01077 [Candida viswanathii]|uniref:Uncharacterized protein n=1 Tax=Candida viswanathii TaxID=5486 RepID=A0A367YHK3_9ASCO|nr:hypothetical protein Cantr_01077 [Candida viswanathii]